MSETQTKLTHTPGPWRICGGATPVFMGIFSDGQGKMVVEEMADCCSPGEARSNARLIAAAPELLEACEGLMEAIASLPPEVQYGLDRVVGNAEWATAKARGLA